MADSTATILCVCAFFHPATPYRRLGLHAHCRHQASTLIGGLAGERTRWTDDSEKSADLKRRLVGDCALGSAFVSYCGPFNQEFRQYMVTDKFTVDLQVTKQVAKNCPSLV